MNRVSCISLKRIAQAVPKTALLAIAMCASSLAQSPANVRFDAEGLAPRSIEPLTEKTIVRDYAVAWRDLAAALDSSNAGKLSEEFTGFAKDKFNQRIAQQRQTGIHVHIVDHGHQLKAIFYSTDGAAMQLVDRVQMEIQVFDGSKLLDSRDGSHEYMVLMTPGSDRWYVRDLEEVAPQAP